MNCNTSGYGAYLRRREKKLLAAAKHARGAEAEMLVRRAQRAAQMANMAIHG